MVPMLIVGGGGYARTCARLKSGRLRFLVPRAALDLSAIPYRARTTGSQDIEVTLGGCNAYVCVAESGLAEGTLLKKVAP